MEVTNKTNIEICIPRLSKISNVWSEKDANEIFQELCDTVDSADGNEPRSKVESTDPTESYKQELRCPECNEICITEISLKIHEQKHNQTRRSFHDETKEQNLRHDNLHQDMLVDSQERQFHYKSISAKTFLQEQHLKSGICSSSFKCKRTLNRHMVTHKDSRPFACDLCSSSFKYKSQLDKHKITHQDLRPFACDICSSRFKSKGNLDKHLSTHKDSRPFACNLCSSSFKWKGNLTAHMVTHQDSRPFSCDMCASSYKLKGTLDRHKKTHQDYLDRP